MTNTKKGMYDERRATIKSNLAELGRTYLNNVSFSSAMTSIFGNDKSSGLDLLQSCIHIVDYKLF